MNLRARLAFASGVAACVGAALLLAGRFDGSIVLAFLFAWAARLAPAATMLGAGPILASGAARTMRLQLILAPAWAFIVAAGAVRAGSVQLADVRGANAVAGLALARGPALTVVGAWAALVAGVAATGARSRIGAVSEASEGARGVVAPPSILRRMELAGAVAQVMLLVTLFAGPQIDGAVDSTWWAAGAFVAGVAVIAVRRFLTDARVSILAAAASLIGLALATIGGPP